MEQENKYFRDHMLLTNTEYKMLVFPHVCLQAVQDEKLYININKSILNKLI